MAGHSTTLRHLFGGLSGLHIPWIRGCFLDRIFNVNLPIPVHSWANVSWWKVSKNEGPHALEVCFCVCICICGTGNGTARFTGCFMQPMAGQVRPICLLACNKGSILLMQTASVYQGERYVCLWYQRDAGSLWWRAMVGITECASCNWGWVHMNNIGHADLHKMHCLWQCWTIPWSKAVLCTLRNKQVNVCSFQMMPKLTCSSDPKQPTSFAAFSDPWVLTKVYCFGKLLLKHQTRNTDSEWVSSWHYWSDNDFNWSANWLAKEVLNYLLPASFTDLLFLPVFCHQVWHRILYQKMLALRATFCHRFIWKCSDRQLFHEICVVLDKFTSSCCCDKLFQQSFHFVLASDACEPSSEEKQWQNVLLDIWFSLYKTNMWNIFYSQECLARPYSEKFNSILVCLHQGIFVVKN